MIVEVKPGEGGEDASIFAEELQTAINAWMSSDPYCL